MIIHQDVLMTFPSRCDVARGLLSRFVLGMILSARSTLCSCRPCPTQGSKVGFKVEGLCLPFGSIINWGWIPLYPVMVPLKAYKNPSIPTKIPWNSNYNFNLSPFIFSWLLYMYHFGTNNSRISLPPASATPAADHARCLEIGVPASHYRGDFGSILGGRGCQWDLNGMDVGRFWWDFRVILCGILTDSTN